MRIVKKRGQKYYLVKRPEFTDEEKLFLNVVSKLALKEFSVEELEQIFLSNKKAGAWLHSIENRLLRKLEIQEVTFEPSELEKKRKHIEKYIERYLQRSKNKKELVEEVTNMLCGVGKLTPLLHDPELEEIIVNGVDKPVWVVHRREGTCKTNIVFHSQEKLLVLLSRIASSGGKELSRSNPLIDTRLPDGSRVNIAIPPASVSPTLTVRKFAFHPFSIIDLINFGTLSLELAAFLWLAVEGMKVSPMNLIISGGAGSGKTTTLNAIAAFIPYDNRVLTIEDTLELNLSSRDNWVQLEATYDYRSKTHITMDDLVKASLRMRPDRIIVGEVRGEEATSLFTAMDVGISGSMGTLHANDAKETILRLESPPMNVHKQLLSLLDLIIVQHRFKGEGGKVVRRVTEVSEVSWMGEQILLNNIYKWDKERDSISRTQLPSQTIEKLAFASGMSKNEITEELKLREGILDWMMEQKPSYEKVMRMANEFYTDRDGFLNKIASF